MFEPGSLLASLITFCSEYLVVSVSDTHFLKVEVTVTLSQIGKTFFLICW